MESCRPMVMLIGSELNAFILGCATGKSVTVYSFLNEFDPFCTISRLESPIEVLMPRGQFTSRLFEIT